MFRFVDSFSGIGGIRLGLENALEKLGIASECVFSCDIDKYANKVYSNQFGNESREIGDDITKIDACDLPDFDILLAGFPCQAFSMMGHRKGFEDTRGTLFFDVARILKEKKPSMFLLENVKGLLSHDKGRTFDVIKDVLTNELGYTIYYKVLNAEDYGSPQHRERIYIVGFREKIDFSFPLPVTNSERKKVADILEDNVVSDKYYISEVFWNAMKRHKERNSSNGNGFGYVILDKNGTSNTLTKSLSCLERNLIVDERNQCHKNSENIRRLTPIECERLQGFPDGWTEGVSDTRRYQLLGNSVCVNVIEKIYSKMFECYFAK